MVTPEAYSITVSPDDSVWTVDRYSDGALQPWGVLEQGPAGEWWVTMGGDTTGSTSGPYLDHVQAMRVLQAWDSAQ